MSSDELLQYVGYIFGVMDIIASYMNIHKVKTIGDAYLGVSGLPGQAKGNCCLNMLNFASCCAQVFGHRFSHPNKGAILSEIASRSVMKDKKKKKKKKVRVASPNSSLNCGDKKDGTTLISSEDDAPDRPSALCLMRIGIAAGPITGGVLQGKTPMFDIW
eukprot:CAMPEP_0174330688 /NCGR_PEP_ID=MMETSP0810-20121108/16877_1 /TAXON_ID=73025 ORGANISM="Eutreptiella gymnastica-like, Strain CCMP1594" /NCGR_SAMPLE_ID=MMETSP0810 /ASSEMBLY_ACC=CAM_ASM_000659 /LENGTH=159 /DNA_ID=CAMNT_0015446005 /DNA_START=89 /DNA_END=565 /DNA_ORIENTATION=-